LRRAFICSSKYDDCMENYAKNTLAYECMLRNKKMTIEEYRRAFNPHYKINDKLDTMVIELDGKEYKKDKDRRIANFKKYGRFEI